MSRLPFWPDIRRIQIVACAQLHIDEDGLNYVQWRDKVGRKEAAVAVLLRARCVQRPSAGSAFRKLPPELIRTISELL